MGSQLSSLISQTRSHHLPTSHSPSAHYNWASTPFTQRTAFVKTRDTFLTAKSKQVPGTPWQRLLWDFPLPWPLSILEHLPWLDEHCLPFWGMFSVSFWSSIFSDYLKGPFPRGPHSAFFSCFISSPWGITTAIASSTIYSPSASKSNSQLRRPGYWWSTHSNRYSQRFCKE